MERNWIKDWIFPLMIIFAFGLTQGVWAAKGKITGRVLDKSSNEPLAGANVVIEGTTLGAAADLEGYYVILNIPPGVYTVKADMIGYAAVLQQEVQVSINQTTSLDFELTPEAVSAEEVVVTATRPVVQLDISASQRIVTAQSIEARPLENLEEILAAEVGVDLTASQEGSGLIVRGGELNETDIVIDGLSTRNERNQQANTNLSLTSIQEIELLTGGFSAEYGDIRSGLVNVITKEGSLDRYSVSFDGRVSPTERKHFGPSPYSTEGPFWQVYAGPDALTGVNQSMVDAGQYPFSFVGWNEVSRQFLADSDPSNDYTPQQALEIWKWQHRTREYATQPDYIGDLSFSGRLPFTNATFLLSQRYENLQLVYPFSRTNSITGATLLKITTRLSSNMKLTLNNNYIISRGVSGSIFDDTVGMITGTREGTAYARDVFTERRFIWHDANFNPIETKQYRGGLDLNHVLSGNTFYDLRFEFTDFRAKQEPIGLRDTTGIASIGTVTLDEQPVGYVGSELGRGITEEFDILGRDLMSGGGRGQDHSKYWGIAFYGDMVSQINKHNEVKFGFSFEYTKFSERREINHGETTTPPEEAPWLWWFYDDAPVKLSGYVRDKIEFQGMIANLGVRLDYFNSGNSPYNLDPNFIFENNPYTLNSYQADGWAGLQTSDSGSKFYVSPRLGISHPVSSTSKIFFNYGHFLQPPVIDQLFLVRPNSTGRGGNVANVQAAWPRTVAYEVGFEQGIGDEFLMHLTGYYKDVSDQLSTLNIVSIDGENDVSTYDNTSYADIRGLELRLEKRMGHWWFGWVSLEYLTKSEGLTGFRYIYEDRQLANLQRNQATQIRQDGVPSVTANMNFLTPVDFGPRLLGHHFFGDWRFNVLFQWADGGQALLNPSAPLREQIFVDVIDFSNTDLLVEKRFRFGAGSQNRLGLFLQVKNLFNNRGFVNPQDYNRYVDSLHFPYEQGEQKGNDKLGDWDKEYIEIGWNTWSQFINPRDVFLGVRFNF